MTNNLRNWKHRLLPALSIVLIIGIGNAANAKGLASQPKQFDLVCPLRGKIVSDPHPTYVGTYPANVKRWFSRERFIVDLTLKKYCAEDCKIFGIDPIISVTKTKIILDNRPRFETVIRRKDNFYHARLVDGERVSITTGHCRMEKFSGFPSAVSSR